MFDFSPVGYATLQGDHVIADVNLAASQILGWPRSVLRGMRFDRLITPPDRPDLETLIGTARSVGEKQTVELRLLRNGGEVFSTRVSMIPLLRTEPTLLIAFEDFSSKGMP